MFQRVCPILIKSVGLVPGFSSKKVINRLMKNAESSKWYKILKEIFRCGSRRSFESYKKWHGMGKKTAARKFNIPRATLLFRLSKDFVKSRPGPDTVLTSQEESQLVKWIIESSRKGFPRRKEDITKSVNLFLNKNPRPNSFIGNTPGEGWYKLFLKRHPELSIRTSEAVTSASSKVSENQIRNWFKQIEEYLKENDLFDILSDPPRVYNGDETNFILCPKNTKVIAPKGEKNVYEVDHAQSKSCVTVMFTFGADGEITPPMIIFPLKRMRPEIQKSVPRDWGIGLSDNGWMKAELFNQYIQNVFHPALQKKNVTFPVILFVDGHKSHTTLELSQLCQSLGIILIALYPNATRLLQPADVAAFRPIKVMWRKAVLEWRSNNLTKTLLKTDVGPILEILLPKLKKSTLRNGFEACGLCPFNPDKVDYTKCLMPSRLQQVISDDICSEGMDYRTFEEIVGPQLIRKMKNSVVGKSTEAKKLYEIYKHLTQNILTPSPYLTTIKSNASELMLNLENSTDLQKDMKQTEVLEGNESTATETAFEGTFSEVVSDIAGHENSIEIKPTESEVFNSSCILSLTDALTVPEPIQTVDIISEHQTGNEQFCIPSTSRQNVEFVGGEWVLVDAPNGNFSESPKKFKDFLPLPKTPIKKQKLGAQPQHRSFVLTSKDWENAELEKQQKKLEVIQEKDAKRKARKEKAELNRSAKINKQTKNQNKKKGNIENRNTKKETKNPKIMILSDILLKPANTTNLEKDKAITETEENEVILHNQPIINQNEETRQPLMAINQENKSFTKNEELIQKIQGMDMEQQKTKERSFTKYQENKKDKQEKDKRHGGPTKPLSNEDLLRILEED